MDGVASTDAELLEASIAGDRQAFAQIVERYKSLVCAVTYTRTGDLSLSEDLAQDAFVAAWQDLRDLKDPRKLRAWLYTIATHVAARAVKNKRRDIAAQAQPLADVPDHADATPTPREMAIAKEEQALLWRSIEQIPDTYRLPLVLYYREGQSAQRVAQTLGLSPDAVRQRLSRGRHMLKAEMAAFVEQSLAETRPGKAFGLGVLCVLPRVSAWAPATQQAAGPVAELAAWCLRPFARLLSWCTNLGGASHGAAPGVAAGTEQAAAALVHEAAGPVAKLASWAAGLGVKHAVVGGIAVAAVAGGAAYYASNPSPAPAKMTAGTLVEHYKRALGEQKCLAFKFTTSVQRNASFVSDPRLAADLNGVTDYHYSGELATDGFRVAFRERQWGQSRSHESVPKEKATYRRMTFDGKEYINYSATPDSDGMFYIDLDPLNSHRLPPYEEIVGRVYVGHYLLGHIDRAGNKLDTQLESADALTLRQHQENVNGVDCYVLDFVSEGERGSVWLDPEHGYNLAQVEFHTNKASKRGGTWINDKVLRDVSFENIGGTWVPVSGTLEHHLKARGDRVISVKRLQHSNIRLNPNLDALSPFFSKEDLEDGAKAYYYGAPLFYTWKDGELVPRDE